MRRARRARSSSTCCSTTPAVRTVLLVGVGATLPSDLRRAGAALARRTRGRDRVATSVASLAHDAGLRAFAEGLVLGSFTLRPARPATTNLRHATFVLAGLVRPDAREEALRRGLAAARAALDVPHARAGPLER